MKPPSGGPQIGPISAGMVTSDIALSRCLLWMLRTMIRRPTGVIMAPPTPCAMRAATNSDSVCEAAQQIEPSTNTPMAVRNTLRAPKRSAVQPLAGIKMASDNRYDVTASFSASGLVPSARAIAGSDVAITVESMLSMNRAVATIKGTMRS